MTKNLDQMRLLDIQTKFMEDERSSFINSNAFYARTGVLMGICHARKLVKTHGMGSAKAYFDTLFNADPQARPG